jgi:hypothetical protein
MGFARFSLRGLLGAIGLLAVGLACLMFASSPWADISVSITLGALTVALIGVAYRRGDRRAFWVGFAVCGWAYMALSSGSWFASDFRYHLVTTRLLRWAYPWLIPEARQPANAGAAQPSFNVANPELEEGLATVGLHGPVDVLTKGDSKTPPSLVVEGVEVGGSSKSGAGVRWVTLRVDADQFARLAEVPAGQAKFVLRRHLPGPLAAIRSNPPVQEGDFLRVGHSLFALLCACVGGMVGRYFHATRDPSP